VRHLRNKSSRSAVLSGGDRADSRPSWRGCGDGGGDEGKRLNCQEETGGEAGIRTLGRTLKALQRFSKPPPSASRPPHRASASIRDQDTCTETLDSEAANAIRVQTVASDITATSRALDVIVSEPDPLLEPLFRGMDPKHGWRKPSAARRPTPKSVVATSTCSPSTATGESRRSSGAAVMEHAPDDPEAAARDRQRYAEEQARKKAEEVSVEDSRAFTLGLDRQPRKRAASRSGPRFFRTNGP
jgi:hypothetical protein